MTLPDAYVSGWVSHLDEEPMRARSLPVHSDERTAWLPYFLAY